MLPVPKCGSVWVASGVSSAAGTLTQFIDRTPARASDPRSDRPHRLVVLHVRRQVIALLKPAPRIQRLLSLERGVSRASAACVVPRSRQSANRSSIYRLRNIGGLNLLPPPSRCVISLQRARVPGTLDRGKHLNLLVHCHLQLAHRRDLRLSLPNQPSAPVAAVAGSWLTCGYGHRSAPRDYGCRQTPTSCRKPPRRTARVRATRNRHRGHIELAIASYSWGAETSMTSLSWCSGTSKERAGALLHIGTGQEKHQPAGRTLPQRLPNAGSRGARRPEKRTAFSSLFTLDGDGVRLLLSIRVVDLVMVS